MIQFETEVLRKGIKRNIWSKHPNGSLVRVYTSALRCLAKNGKWYKLYFYSVAMLDDKELLQNDIAIESIKQIKEEKAIRLLIELVAKSLSKRTGIKGYRGYFTLTDYEVK